MTLDQSLWFDTCVCFDVVDVLSVIGEQFLLVLEQSDERVSG
jgi:hypothetical protein